MTNLRKHSARAALAITAFAALAGCASMGPQTPEQQVESRAATYWKARASADPKTAYALLAPAYRDLKSEKDFVGQFGAGANLRDTGVAKVTCEAPDRCTARISLTAKPMVPGLNLPVVTTYLDDTWVLEQGQWWRFEAP
ncbi:hypothetical protein [Acidovorax radicis]|uniref:hypothetical protein n=1 Tax=Acidovorax radicis TaxID=758826 RepID=UPI001CFB8FED|nr:hypothetical protein [Acidovorax radicis]UCU99849.1 hypothetical protein KI609_03370 [Acidovorax radicis]